MKTVAVEDLMIGCILTFCENAAELGCHRDEEVDMWFRELPYDAQYKVVEKMMEIEERNAKMNEDAKTDQEGKGDKIVQMVEIELDLDKKVIDGLIEYALENIKNDHGALVNYAANKILKEIAETDGECLNCLKED